MGSTVCQAVAAEADLELVCAVDPRLAGIDVRPVTGAESRGMQVEPEVGGLARAGAEVAVDFTEPAAAMANMAWCAANGVHAVVGTTGLSDGDVESLDQWFSDSSANCILAANFAIGAVLMMRFAALAAPYVDSAEVVELHHDAKADAPSGTALVTAERMAAARRAAGAGDFKADLTTSEVVDGARGGIGPAGLRLHSVRLRGLVSHQEVLLGTTGQSLTIRHDSYDRTSFLPGILLAIRAVADRPGLTLGIDALLG